MEIMNEEEMLNVLAINIRFYRKKKDMSIKELSKIIGKSPNYIKKLENCGLKRVPSFDVVYKISIVLNATFGELLNKENIKKHNIGGNHVYK